MSFKESFETWGKRFVAKSAYKLRGIKNLVALLVLPAATLGFCWGWMYWEIIKAISTEPTIRSIFKAAGLAQLGSYFLAALCPFAISIVMILPICRSLQILLPDVFDEELLLDGETK